MYELLIIIPNPQIMSIISVETALSWSLAVRLNNSKFPNKNTSVGCSTSHMKVIIFK